MFLGYVQRVCPLSVKSISSPSIVHPECNSKSIVKQKIQLIVASMNGVFSIQRRRNGLLLFRPFYRK